MFEFLCVVGFLGLGVTSIFTAVYLICLYIEEGNLLTFNTLFLCTLWTMFFAISLAGLKIGRPPESALQIARQEYYNCMRTTPNDKAAMCVKSATEFYKNLTKEGRSGLTLSPEEVTKVDG